MRRFQQIGFSSALVGAALGALAFLPSAARPSRGPRLDGITRRTQGAFTLVDIRPTDNSSQCLLPAIERTDPLHRLAARLLPSAPPAYAGVVYTADTPGGFGAWIDAPGLVGALAAAPGDPKLLTASARGAYGPEAAVRWSTPTVASSVLAPSGRLIFVEVPGGYPADWRYVDITVRTPAGASACWRVTGLPPSRRAVPPARASRPLDVEGARLTPFARMAAASDGHGASTPAVTGGVAIQGRPHGALRYDLELVGLEKEWEPATRGQPRTTTSVAPIDGHAAELDLVRSAPFGADHWVRIAGALQQHDQIEERVVLRGVQVRRSGGGWALAVGAARAVDTASGVRVTLPPQAPDGRAARGELSFALAFPSSARVDDLPGSALARRQDGPISLSISRADGASVAMDRSGPGGVHRIALLPAAPLRDGPLTLTLYLRQRVDLERIPISFTVPVAPAGKAGGPGSRLPGRGARG